MESVSFRTVWAIILITAIFGCDSATLMDPDTEEETTHEVSISLSVEYADGSVLPVFKASTDSVFRPLINQRGDQVILEGSRFSSDGSSLLLGAQRWPSANSGSLVSLDLTSSQTDVVGDRFSYPIASSIRQGPRERIAFRRKEPGITTQWSVAVLSSELQQAPGTSQEWVAGWTDSGSLVTVSEQGHKVYWYNESLTKTDSLVLDATAIASRVGSDWRAYHPDLNVDASQIVFSVSAAGALSQIAVADLATGQTQWITQTSTDHEDLPVWGPGGAVYFLSYDGSFGTHFNSSIKVYSAAGNLSVLTSDDAIGVERIQEVSVSW